MISIEGCLNSSLGATNKSQQMHKEQLQRKQEAATAHAAGRHRPPQQAPNDNDAAALSTIAILRRHPMYDSLVLVKKYRPCLGGYTLEFPTSTNAVADDATKGDEQNNQTQVRLSSKFSSSQNDCILGKAYDVARGRTKLVSVYLDGDDPIYQHKLRQQNETTNDGGEQHDGGEIVYVPINGLLQRLNNYDRHGISIDSRVYAFAMGLKTAERFLTSSTEKEVQEAPPL